MTGSAPPPPVPPPPAPVSPTAPGAGVPWERRRELGLVSALLGTASESLFQPAAFFRRVDPAGPLAPPLVYAVLVSLAAFAIQVLYDLALPNPFTAWLPVDQRVSQAAPGLVLMAVVALFVPVIVPVVILVFAAIYHGLLLLFGGPVRGFGGTLRATAYASSAQLFAIVPFCGTLLALVWGCVLQVIGLREVHGVSTGKAVAAVVVPFLLCAVLVLAVVVVILAGAAAAAWR